MTEFYNGFSYEKLADCERVLNIGKIPDKLGHIYEVMEKYCVMENEVIAAMVKAGSSNRDTYGPETVRAVSKVLFDDAAARNYVAFSALKTSATKLAGEMRYKKKMLDEDASADASVIKKSDERIAREKITLQRIVADLSESPPFVVAIAVNAYIDTLGHHLGLPEHSIELG